VWLRVPPDYKARELGSALARAASTCGKKLSVIASTDLTHYGPSYGFMPHGVGESAVDWVRDENDRGFIAAALSMDTDRVLATRGSFFGIPREPWLPRSPSLSTAGEARCADRTS